MKELAPRSKVEYERALRLAFGRTTPPFGEVNASVANWSAGRRVVLRAAIAAFGGLGDRDALLARLPPVAHATKKVPRIPAESEARAYEAATTPLNPSDRAIALLPLALGLRASEVLHLSREMVERALRTGELRFVRKGDKEMVLDIEHARSLLEALLTVSAFVPTSGVKITSAIPPKPKAWRFVYEILTNGKPNTAYHKMHKLVRRVGSMAQINDLCHIRPHLLRHAFATRMNRDGAPLTTIQYALGHKSIKTTALYVHPSAEDVKKYVRKF